MWRKLEWYSREGSDLRWNFLKDTLLLILDNNDFLLVAISCTLMLEYVRYMMICNILCLAVYSVLRFLVQEWVINPLLYMLCVQQPSFKAEFIDYKSIKLLMMSIWYLQGSKIRTLPPILTFSLLRFNYDFQRGERFKVTLILIKWVDNNQHWISPKNTKAFRIKYLFFRHFLKLYFVVYFKYTLNVINEKSKQSLWIDKKCSQVETPLVGCSNRCFFVPCSWHVDHIISHFFTIKLKIYHD